MTEHDGRDDGGERFLSRWSRLKTQARHEAPAPARPEHAPTSLDVGASDLPRAEDRQPEVPPVESLSLDSDYRPFFHPKIDEGLRRAALKKLFHDPHFNVMDGLDVYIDDYSKPDPIPEAMLAELEQAKNILAWAREDAEARAARDAAAARTAALDPQDAADAQPAPGHDADTDRRGDAQPKDGAQG